MITDKFLDFGRTKAAALGLADLPLVAIPHPISGRLADEVARMAAEAVPPIVRGLRGEARP